MAAVEHVLQVYGIDIGSGEWGKPLREGPYEFRIWKSLRTILVSAGLDVPEEPDEDRIVHSAIWLETGEVNMREHAAGRG